MIQYNITCSRCGFTWNEDFDEHREKIPKYSITEYVRPPHRTQGRYKRIDFCPKCEKAFEKFLACETEVTPADFMDEWYVAKADSDAIPTLIRKDKVEAHIAIGFKVVTLMSYLKTHKIDKGE